MTDVKKGIRITLYSNNGEKIIQYVIDYNLTNNSSKLSDSIVSQFLNSEKLRISLIDIHDTAHEMWVPANSTILFDEVECIFDKEYDKWVVYEKNYFPF